MKQGTALWLSAVLALSLGCAGGSRLVEPADQSPQATSPARIEAIVPTQAADRTRVVVQANAPLLIHYYFDTFVFLTSVADLVPPLPSSASASPELV